MKKKIYVTPAIETVSIAIEQGIAASGPQNVGNGSNELSPFTSTNDSWE